MVSIAQPKVEFDSKTIDFGKIIEGTISTHRFTYKNTGDQPFIISHVSVTCGCTAPQWSSQPLAPGDTASLFVQFDSKNKMGAVAKGVNLMTNCPDAIIGLIILADIIPDTNFIATFDSLSNKPFKLAYYKSFSQVIVPLKLFSKKGFKGTEADLEKLVKQVLKEKNPLLYNSVWFTSENGLLITNMMDKNLQAPYIALIKEEVLNKKRLKYWSKRVKN